MSGNTAFNSCDNSCGPRGGGIVNEPGATLTLHNSTVADNKASGGCNSNCASDGGGLYNAGATIALGAASATLTNDTFSGNSVAGGCGGGCGNNGAAIDNEGDVNIGATIVANSTGASNCADVALSDIGDNLDDDGSCGFTTASHDLSNTPSGLDPAGLQDNGGPTKTIELPSHERGGRPRRRRPVPGHRPAGIAPADAVRHRGLRHRRPHSRRIPDPRRHPSIDLPLLRQ